MKFYDWRGKRISRDEWIKLWDPDADRHVASTKEGDVWVSTVWLGIDHGFGRGPPIIFETMIFGGDRDGDQWRYSNLDDALEGHRRACLLAFGP